MIMRRIAVLGSTGSIGTQTLDVARRHPDKIKVVALAAGKRATEVFNQAHEFGITKVALSVEPTCDVPDGIDVRIG
ncbi:MAG: 1-deoxy-D-xylulose-5-phosphate reductoisomerase, partial [Eggerthellaceae bacterium]|nr:1-deoxy-D-xylulose-5-phosphate reductoisomerase [Eggerthellaceae bacterium]